MLQFLCLASFHAPKGISHSHNNLLNVIVKILTLEKKVSYFIKSKRVSTYKEETSKQSDRVWKSRKLSFKAKVEFTYLMWAHVQMTLLKKEFMSQK